MSDPIFPDQSEPEKAIDFIANPVRVELQKYTARAEGRRWAQLDLIALANNILDRERECAELRRAVQALTIRLSGMQSAIEALNDRAERTTPHGMSAKLLSGLEAFADAMADDESDEDPY